MAIRKRKWFTKKQIQAAAKRAGVEDRDAKADLDKLLKAARSEDHQTRATAEDKLATLPEGPPQQAWVLDYVDQHGERRLKTFKTKGEATAWSIKARHEVQQGTHTAASISKTITEAWELWLADCEANDLEYGTIKQRRQHLKLHVESFIGCEKLSSLTMPRVRQFDDQLRDNGRSLAMRRKIVTNLKTMLTFAQGRGLVAQNVARGVKVRSDERNQAYGPIREGVDFPSRSELKTFMEMAAGRWRPGFIRMQHVMLEKNGREVFLTLEKTRHARNCTSRKCELFKIRTHHSNPNASPQ